MSDLIERARKSKSLLVPNLKEELIDHIEQLQAEGKMKDKRIDWTVYDNVKKAITIELLQDKVNQWERWWWFDCDSSDEPPYQPDYPAPPEDNT